jgi:hypothetical protein
MNDPSPRNRSLPEKRGGVLRFSEPDVIRFLAAAGVPLPVPPASKGAPIAPVPRFYSASEIARLLHVSRAWIWKLHVSGRLRGFYLGRQP